MRNQFNLLFKNNMYIDNLLTKLSKHKLKNNNYLNKKKWKYILKNLIKNSDQEIYKILRDMYKQENCFSIERGIIMASKIINIVKSFPINISSLLDYGCSNGTITKELAKRLNVTKIYGADIIPIENPDFNFILLKENNLMPLIKDKSIDFINASMVLHHVKNINETLNEFRRIISDKGIIVLREHDCTDENFAYFLDILHGLYSLVWSEPMEDPNFVNTYEAYYKNFQEWDKIFWKFGFKKIYFNYKKSVINAYYAVYTPNILEGNRIIH
jgi:ubiquinone/menaquinone biosynthesis C-methylase UbiE